MEVAFDPIIDAPARLGEFFRDDGWLAAHGPLTRENVLDYFSGSPFYTVDSINERLKLREIEVGQVRLLTGVEYVVAAATPAEAPVLFVVHRIHRRAGDDGPGAVLSVYYCLLGTVYQCPDLATLLTSRIAKVAHHVTMAVAEVEGMRPLLGGPGGRGGADMAGLAADVEGAATAGAIAASPAAAAAHLAMLPMLSQFQSPVTMSDGERA